MKKAGMFLAIALVSIGCLFAGGTKEAKNGYVFAADATWPPLEFVDNGTLTGFEVELMPLIGEKVGVPMTVKNIPWDTIFAGLANGAYDGVSSGVTVTEERKNSMDFSTPILQAGQVVIIRTTDKSTVKGIENLTGKKIGVQIGTTGDFALENYQVTKKVYDDIGLAIEDLLNGNLDAAVCDSLIASDFVLANANYSSKLTVAGEPFTQEDIAIAVKKGNTELLNLVNKGLQMMKDDGSFDALKQKWNLL
ncbi:periplasmic component of amino acid ABC-type transporter/signal transduction system [Sphaerochaeta pleomorpha str. Grapes]|uniref:Periplasmic component of amino acid ABC-type transporter/signal transduction system n=1 Tax=Sphaerochaeta pleomorpha (strain ATCC BAA-1885 / DSM 22778 / Grapes) TaxID=158190 RepID=G8QY17_SPHPG|nr:basic amino acid ABC transporter substrate-binding protein [Sphaerochaeta pleomorpha]AEV28522.1 periplasmic component of amino acid ABC-type transporter/signal transduction system [Sphaerochaeta pleomorpha str. Grapes]